MRLFDLRVLASLAVTLTAAALVACSDPEPAASLEEAGAPASDAATAFDAPGTTDVPDAAVVCNALSTSGLSVGKVHTSASRAPAALGGTIEDGTYVYVDSLLFEMGDLPVVDAEFQRVVLTGNVAQIARDPSPDRSVGDRTSTETWTRAGSTLTVQQTCPKSGEARVLSFTVEQPDGGGKTRLVVYATGQGVSGARVFEKE